nr:unnamed protein product [Callosobruchus analis]
MLDWPFCVGLLVGPTSLASRIRGLAAQHEITLSAISDLRPSMVSRKEAYQELGGGVSDDDSTVSRQRVTPRGKEESRLEVLEKGQQEMREMIRALLKSSQRPGTPEYQYYLEDDEDEEDEFENIVSDNESAGTSWKAPSPAPPTIMDWDFAPHTVEKEPLFPAPKPSIEAHPIECQRLGSQSFNSIRYAEVQKKLQAAPVFAALQVNPQLKLLTRDCQEFLVKTETSLGTITHMAFFSRERERGVFRGFEEPNRRTSRNS